MIRRLAALLALVAGGIAVPLVTAPVHSASAASGACVDNVGITIVVDFHELGGGVNVRCAPGPVSSGLDALDKAGIVWESVRRFPGFVCRIAGLPGPDKEACINTPPANAYWSYWVAPRGGTWCYSSRGPGARIPPAGAVEGWSFTLGKTGADTPPPGMSATSAHRRPTAESIGLLRLWQAREHAGADVCSTSRRTGDHRRATLDYTADGAAADSGGRWLAGPLGDEQARSDPADDCHRCRGLAHIDVDVHSGASAKHIDLTRHDDGAVVGHDRLVDVDCRRWHRREQRRAGDGRLVRRPAW